MALLLVMSSGYFLVLLDVTIVNVALPSISADLGAGVGALQWVVVGYAVPLAALMLAGGAAGDVYGHRRLVLAGLSAFGAASLWCGLAPGPAALVAGRAVQGAGAALMLPGTLAVIARAHPDPAARARAIGVWAAAGSAALPAGPLLGGVLVALAGWRAVFLLNVPIVAVALVLAARVVPADASSAGRRLRGRDVLPLELFRDRAFAAANAIAGAMNLATLGLLFLVTLYLQDARHLSAPRAGLALLPLFLPLVVVAPLAGRVVARTGPRPPMTAGLLLAAAGTALLGLRAPVEPSLLAWGAGIAVLTPAVVAAAIAAAPRGRSGLASAVNNAARQAGGAIGVVAFGALAARGASQALHAGGLAAAAVFVAAAAGCGLTASSNSVGG